MGTFCVANIWNVSHGNVIVPAAESTSVEENVDDPRTQAARILHPWNKAAARKFEEANPLLANPLAVPLWNF